MTATYKPIPQPTTEALARLESGFVRSPSGCWEFTRTESHGYGIVFVNPRSYYAHRLSYVWLGGKDLPTDLTIDHLCRNRRCINPDHLEPVDQGTNTLRGYGAAAINARKDACPKCGSEFVPGTYERRKCPNCSRTRNRDDQRTRRADPVVGEHDRVLRNLWREANHERINAERRARYAAKKAQQAKEK